MSKSKKQTNKSKIHATIAKTVRNRLSKAHDVIQTGESSNQMPWFVVQDARERNELNRWRYSAAEQVILEDFRDQALRAFQGRAWINFRKNFPCVKIESRKVSNWNELTTLENMVKDFDAEVVDSGKSRIYRFPKLSELV